MMPINNIDERRYISAKKLGRLLIRHRDVIRHDDVPSMIGRETIHQNDAACVHTILIERVKSLPPLLPGIYQIGLLQQFEVMADCRLFNLAAKPVYDIVDAQPFAAQMAHDFLPGVVGDGFGKKNQFLSHTPYYIDIHQYVKHEDRQMFLSRSLE